MILLVTTSSSATELRKAIEPAVGDAVKLAKDPSSALRHLRQQEFEAVVLDHSVLCDRGISALLQHLGTAVPVSVNTVLSNSSRIVAEVKNALHRRGADRCAARRAAGRELREDLRNALTGILLSSELALSAPSLPLVAETRLRQVVELAEAMKRTLAM